MKNPRCKNTPNLFTKTNAQRQQEYRQRQKDKQGVRLDMYLDKDIHAMLEQIATAGDMGLKATISTLIKKEHSASQKKTLKTAKVLGIQSNE